MSNLDWVLVLAGGLSPEREVSLCSGQRVADALRRVGICVELRDVGQDLITKLTADPPSVVFPMLHGISGEDGTPQELLSLANVPYVGSTPQACRFAFDKPIAKALFGQAGLLTPPSVTLPRDTFHDLGAAAVIDLLLRRLQPPVFVKPRTGGSALGVTCARTVDDLPAALMSAFGYHDTALIEKQVAGREITVGVLDTGDGPLALPAMEIMPEGGVYDYAARYTAGATQFVCPARLSSRAAAAAAEAALIAHRFLGLRDLSRSDLIVDSEDRVHILETNVAPGMTETSTFPIALRTAGRDLGMVCRDLAACAANRG